MTQALLAIARAKPEALSYGMSGNGTSAHLEGELLDYMAKVKILAIPYKGLANAIGRGQSAKATIRKTVVVAWRSRARRALHKMAHDIYSGTSRSDFHQRRYFVENR